MFALAEWLSAGGQAYSWRGDCSFWLAHRPFDLAAGDVRLLAALAEPGDKSAGYRPFEFVVQAVEELLGQQAVGSRALAEAVADQVLGWNAMVYHGGCADRCSGSIWGDGTAVIGWASCGIGRWRWPGGRRRCRLWRAR